MRFLLTNDDGIDAPGLLAMERAVRSIGESTVAAPEDVWSCKGHAITTREPIRWTERGPGRVAVAGTPADCVRLGLFRLATDASWVLAGVNEGANLGADVFHSGTVAAAREAVLHGTPAIAVSHYFRRDWPLDWDRASTWVSRLIARLVARGPEPGLLWSINLPHLAPESPDPEVVFCAVDPSPLPLHFEVSGTSARYAGNYHGRKRLPGMDIDHCFGGRITVSAIRVLESDTTVPDGWGDDPSMTGAVEWQNT